jgi:hypothetical protein
MGMTLGWVREGGQGVVRSGRWIVRAEICEGSIFCYGEAAGYFVGADLIAYV